MSPGSANNKANSDAEAFLRKLSGDEFTNSEPPGLDCAAAGRRSLVRESRFLWVIRTTVASLNGSSLRSGMELTALITTKR